jgi:hypothetical protein
MSLAPYEIDENSSVPKHKQEILDDQEAQYFPNFV